MSGESTPSGASVRCNNCGAVQELAGVATGARVKCRKCGAMLVVGRRSLVGRTIAGYHILEKIGQGGMGAVYLAEQVRLKRKVAFKALKGARSQDKGALEGLRREAISAAQLSHVNIVQVYDISVADGVAFIAMEYVDGVTVHDMLAEQGKFSAEETITIARQVLLALQRAHKQGIVHLDIKPGNIMVDREGVTKLTDFGLARMMTAEPPEGERRYGTISYMPPEQARSADVDLRADLYALGATMYQMLTGRPPYRGENPRATLKMVLESPTPDPCEANPEVPDALGALVWRLMAKDRDERPQNAREALDELDWIESELRGDGTLGGVRDKTSRGRWKNVAAAFRVSVVLLALVLAVGLWAYKDSLFGKPALRPEPSDAKRQEDERMARLKEMFDVAARYEKENPGRFEQIIRNYQNVAAETVGTRYQIESQTRIAVARERRRKRADALLKRLRQEAMTLCDKLDYVAAAAALDKWPERFDAPAFARRLTVARQEIARRAKSDLQRLLDAAGSAIEDGEFAKARTCLRKLRSARTADGESLSRSVAEAESRLKQGERAAEQKWARSARSQYPRIREEAEALAAKRQYRKAEALLARRARDRRMKAVAGLLRADARNVGTARRVFELALDGLKKGIAKGIRIKGIRYKFKRLDGDRLTYEVFGGQERATPVAEIKPQEIGRLARLAMRPLDGKKLLQLAAFFICERRPPAARKALREAENAGAEVPRGLEEALERLERPEAATEPAEKKERPKDAGAEGNPKM